MPRPVDYFFLAVLWILAIFLLVLFGKALKRVISLRKRDQALPAIQTTGALPTSSVPLEDNDTKENNLPDQNNTNTNDQKQQKPLKYGDKPNTNVMHDVRPFFRRSITCAIACFAMSSLCAAIAIQLEVVHKLKPEATMHQASMVLMNVGRRLMFVMFIGRLYFTFKDTDFIYSNGVFKCLIWSFLLEWGYFFAVCGTLFAIFGFLPSAEPVMALPVSGIAMIWDLTNFLIVGRLFARNLWTLFYHTLKDSVDGNRVSEHEIDLIYLVMKYRILVFWAVVSSIIVIIVLLIQISTNDYILSLFIIVLFHNTINAICLYSNFEFSHDLYNKMFHCCHNSCARIGLWKAVHSNQIDKRKVTLSHIDRIVLRRMPSGEYSRSKSDGTGTEKELEIELPINTAEKQEITPPPATAPINE